MAGRIHVVIDEREREAFRARAAEEGISLSEWLREAARERLERGRPAMISSVDDLDRFFAERSEAEAGAEPDWEQHVSVMGQSRRGGLEPA
ncbi:MAG: antitoxin [Chloroflexota bacterium]